MNIVTVRRLKGGLLAVSVAAAALALAPQASAHTPAASISCTAWSISGSNYEAQQDNTWSVSIDGAAPVGGHFGAGFSESGTFPADSGNHHLVGHVWQNNNPNAKYSHGYTLSTEGCSLIVQAVPVAPLVTQAQCDKDSGTLTPPVVQLASTVGVTYTKTDSKGGVVVTATPLPGYVLVAGGGFTLNRDGTAELLVTFDVVPCEKPSPPSSPPASTPPVTPPVTPPASHSNPPTHSTSHSAPVARPVAHTTPLASTGPHTGALIGVGIACLVGGIALLLLAGKRGDHS